MTEERISLAEFRSIQKEEKKGRNRYGNRKKEDKPTEDGFIFDSDAELYRYRDLKILRRIGEIRNLSLKPVFLLAEKVINVHGQAISKWEYEADYEYITVKDNVRCVEDVKSLSKDKKYGTAKERSYHLSRNELMRQNPNIRFVETIY